MKFGIAVVVLAAAALAGCAAGVTRQTPLAGNAQPMPRVPVQTVSVVLTDSGKKAFAENATFNQDELLLNVKHALDAKGMMVANGAASGTRMEIQVTDVRVRSTVSAVLLGFMAGSDSITGDVVIFNADGRELDRFKVDASYAMGGFAGGQDSIRMNWLYQSFAEQTVKELSKT